MLIDHSSINRWAVPFLPYIEKMTRKHKHSVVGSWPMLGDTPAECVEREVHEEVSVPMSAQELLEYYLFEVAPWTLITCCCEIQIRDLKVLV